MEAERATAKMVRNQQICRARKETRYHINGKEKVAQRIENL